MVKINKHIVEIDEKIKNTLNNIKNILESEEILISDLNDIIVEYCNYENHITIICMDINYLIKWTEHGYLGMTMEIKWMK